MKYPVFTILLALFVSTAWTADAGAAAESTGKPAGVAVEASGSGRTLEQATTNAVRQAVMKAAADFLRARGRRSHFVLLRDTLGARAGELASAVQVKWSRKELDEELWNVIVTATVDMRAFKKRWFRLESLLRKFGRPRVLVYVIETVDGKPVEVSSAQRRIERILRKEGIAVVNAAKIPGPDANKLARAAAAGKLDGARAAAAGQGAHLLIIGRCQARLDRRPKTATMPPSGQSAQLPADIAAQFFTRYLAEGSATCYRVADGAKLAQAQAAPASGSKPLKQDAADQAVGIVAKRLGYDVRRAVLRAWPEAISMPASGPATQPARQPHGQGS